MKKRNHYVNSLFKCYTKYNDFEFVATPDFLMEIIPACTSVEEKMNWNEFTIYFKMKKIVWNI
ncbi:hypothetical protein [Spiroplasma ixodetis]